MPKFLTEDEVRDAAKILLNFNITEPDVVQGTGQVTTFNQLGFTGKLGKPDGWYFPKDLSKVAIVLETKSLDKDLSKQEFIDELTKNMNIVLEKYSKVVGILWNGQDIRVFKNKIETVQPYIEEITETVSNRLESKHYYIELYYIELYENKKLDKGYIYDLTQKINNTLHFKFGMIDLQDRMIFTACALVAQRFDPKEGLQKRKNEDYKSLHNLVSSQLEKTIERDNNNATKSNSKLEILIEEYNKIDVSEEQNKESVNLFIDCVCEISELINSNYWNGEDVMAIFFNEFNRYRGKAQVGQVFTPEHIASFMYRLIDVGMNDRVLDATCGSGTFLVKAMSKMIKEAGKNQQKIKDIKSNQLFGIEFYRKVYALACANMLIHEDGKTNLEQLDARTEKASTWIKNKNINKVLMNPPYERKYGCMSIVKNVLDNVQQGAKCAFILPDKKLEKDGADKKYGNKILKDHKLKTIIKLPENLFLNGTTPSIFIFEAGKPQNSDNIVGYYIEDDGLETVKNKGRMDVKDKWQNIEDYWINAICNDGHEFYGDTQYQTRQIINPKEHLSYQMPEKPFEISEEDFRKTAMDYICFKRGINTKEFGEKLLNAVLYSSKISSDETGINIKIDGASSDKKKS